MARRTNEAPTDGAYAVATHPDPWLSLHANANRLGAWDQLLLGVRSDTKFLYSAPGAHVLCLGPPRSFKTSGILASAVITHPGPVVVTSTKGDVYAVTAIARARMGQLYQYAPGGLKPEEILAGAIQLRWSPIYPSRAWGQAQVLGKALAEASEVSASTGDNAAFFKKTSGQLIACILHAAALGEKPMEFVLEAVGEGDALDECENILRQADDDYANIAADELRSYRKLDGRTRGSIFITASTAFSAYRYPGAIESTRDPNFDEHQFVSGEWTPNPGLFSPDDWQAVDSQPPVDPMWLPHGHFDTIYITSGSQARNQVAPLVVGLLSRLREARYALHRYDMSNRRPRPPLFFALDEIANIAPIQELPGILSEGSSQGVLVMAVMQDLAQAKARWPQWYDSFLTMFREVIVFPGIRNEETVHRLSMLSGDVWEENTQWGYTFGKKKENNNESETISQARRVKYSMAEISAAAEQGQQPTSLDPRRILVLQANGVIGWGFCAPYFYTPPISEALMACADYIIDRTERDSWERRLPLPIMQPQAMIHPQAAIRWWEAILKEFYGERPV